VNWVLVWFMCWPARYTYGKVFSGRNCLYSTLEHYWFLIGFPPCPVGQVPFFQQKTKMFVSFWSPDEVSNVLNARMYLNRLVDPSEGRINPVTSLVLNRCSKAFLTNMWKNSQRKLQIACGTKANKMQALCTISEKCGYSTHMSFACITKQN